MAHQGNILLVDDEELFCKSTADLLQMNGYNCDCGSDGPMASRMLMENNYDLLISDIRMRGNHELELINTLKNKDTIIPVILVTGYPSLKTAIQSIQLPVEAYMVKPLDFEELKENVDNALKKSHFMKILHNSHENIKSLDEKLSWTNDTLKQVYTQNQSVPVETFVSLITGNIINSTLNLNELLSESATLPGIKNICHLYDCPRLNVMQRAIKETIEILENTKKSFKSKELATLRKNLELLLDDTS